MFFFLEMREIITVPGTINRHDKTHLMGDEGGEVGTAHKELPALGCLPVGDKLVELGLQPWKSLGYLVPLLFLHEEVVASGVHEPGREHISDPILDTWSIQSEQIVLDTD